MVLSRYIERASADGGSTELEHAGTEVLEQTYQIDPTARLTIRNLSGSISIRGADAPELRLHATKKPAEKKREQDRLNSVLSVLSC